MQNLIFTIDYEIHGNGDGSPSELMIEPTNRLMDLLDEFGAKLVIFADVGEILRFKEYLETYGHDAYDYEAIVAQLQDALRRGHDVQLHIHSSYFGARFENGKWQQNWKKYNLAGLEADEIRSIVATCKGFLEETLRPVKPDYSCYVFRAANWSMHPSPHIVDALAGEGICIDTSVYKYGRQKGWVDYDYSEAFDATFPYRASRLDVCRFDPEGPVVEFPIHCELKPIGAFFSPIRVFRALRALKHRHERNYAEEPAPDKPSAPKTGLPSKLRKVLFSLHPRKFDFNQLTGRQMVKTLKSIRGAEEARSYITLIGHSKSFIPYNGRTLKRFLQYVNRYPQQYAFSLFPGKDELHRFHTQR